MYHQEVWASDCSFIDVTCENWLFVYCFLAINSHLLKHAQTGAVQPHVKPADIHDFDLVIPPHETIQKFQNTISSFIRKKGIIEQESRRLAQLRDTLLPRLMSGEIKVGDVTL
jgi:type I restriction enzyme S subunit